MLKIGRIVMGICQTNCYFLYEEGSKECIFVDPADHGDVLFQKLKQAGFTVDSILITHGHFDHIWGAQKLRGLTGAKIYALDKEEEILTDSGKNLSESAGRGCTLKVNEFLHDGQEIELLGHKVKVIATPGHTIGGCCYYFEEDGILVAGDTLFLESIGRTDFVTGSESQLIRSVREKLFVLPDETKVYPGHGPETTIGHEKKYNPFCV